MDDVEWLASNSHAMRDSWGLEAPSRRSNCSRPEFIMMRERSRQLRLILLTDLCHFEALCLARCRQLRFRFCVIMQVHQHRHKDSKAVAKYRVCLTENIMITAPRYIKYCLVDFSACRPAGRDRASMKGKSRRRICLFVAEKTLTEVARDERRPGPSRRLLTTHHAMYAPHSTVGRI